jgi:hypothetical protein
VTPVATTQIASQMEKGFGERGVGGTVVSVSRTTITLTGKDGKTYTIDASKAAIEKTVTIAAGDIKAGDTLMVGGTVDGTSVSALHIMDGTLPQGGLGGPGGQHGRAPGVMGTVSAINGSTLTVLGKNGTTYSVDATNAKVLKGTQGAKPTDSTLGAIAVGDTVGIQGTVSGTTVTAKEIMDGVFGNPMGRGFGGIHMPSLNNQATK